MAQAHVDVLLQSQEFQVLSTAGHEPRPQPW